MTESSEQQKKTPENKDPASIVKEKIIQDKKHFWGITTNHFGNKNTSFNRPWFGWKSWWGRPVVRKHAARSR